MTWNARVVWNSVVLGLLAFGCIVSSTHASHITPEEVIALATERAEAWGASSETVLRVIRCETGGKYSPHLVGRSGELGLGQWLRGGAWGSTRQSREWGIDVRAMYQAGDPDAVFWDIDGLSFAFSPQAPPNLRYQWSCY